MTQVCSPVLETAAIKYSVQTGCHWRDKHYYPGTKQCHTGIDLNDVRGGDSDLGNIVRCVADGQVVAAGDYPDWGGIVLVYHPQLQVYTQYAHLYNVAVRAGQAVTLGQQLGQIGKGARSQFWAHLHFEVRKSKLAANYWPSSHVETRAAADKFIREHYLDPEEWLESHHALRGYDEVMELMEARKRGQASPKANSERRWHPVFDSDTNKAITGEYISVKRRADGTVRVYKVPRWKLKQEGML